MSQDQWTAVDRYINELFVPPDPALDAALEDSAAAGMPAINVAPNQGKLLHIAARLLGARAILEIGTLGGYSTIWLARALTAGGGLVTLESNARHAEVARGNIARAGLEEVVDLREGPALETLPRLLEEAYAFDLIFIDADKQNNPNYFTWALRLSHPGTLIIIDNVVRKGAVVDARSPDPAIQGIRRLNEMLASETRVVATEIQTVGLKGYDGFAIVLVNQVQG